MTTEYPIENDDEVMRENALDLARVVVGRRIVSAEHDDTRRELVLTLDDRTRVRLCDSSDCCAYTGLEKFLLHPERVEHVITGVRTEGCYETWHIYADIGDVLELGVGWGGGSGYYAYGFYIQVEALPQ